MDLKLSGLTVVVTGASRGIGRATAIAFADEGARVVLVARSKDALQQTEREIAQAGGVSVPIPIDVTEDGSSDAIVEAACRNFGHLDIVIANAGGSFGGGLGEAALSDWLDTYELNVTSAVSLLQASVPRMTEGVGSAVFVSSISGRLPVVRRAQYGAAKAGMTHAARSLAIELANRNIRVNAVSPGSVYFEEGGWDRRKKTEPKRFERFLHDHPHGRLGTPEEIARVVTFVASPAAAWINGADIAVDGGQLIASYD